MLKKTQIIIFKKQQQKKKTKEYIIIFFKWNKEAKYLLFKIKRFYLILNPSWRDNIVSPNNITRLAKIIWKLTFLNYTNSCPKMNKTLASVT